jgi:hypothetical protein
MADEKPKPQTPPPVPDGKRQVWITCRGSRPCGGKTATMVFRNRRPGGGFDVRYRCTQCGGSFHVAT